MNRISFLSFPILATEHFALRQLTSEDDDEIFSLRSDKETNKDLDKTNQEKLENAAVYSLHNPVKSRK
jgi:ribosomal-protein-alanine N-acetyltransferase